MLARGVEQALFIACSPQRSIGFFVGQARAFDGLLAYRQLGVELLEPGIRLFALRARFALIRFDLRQLGPDLTAAMADAIDQFLEPNRFQLQRVHLRSLLFSALTRRIARLLR